MFITFEGPDGSGKTTQVALLVEFLTGEGFPVLHVREPGGTEIGEQIRDILHSRANQAMQPRAEILLYSASRAQLVGEKIRPALAASQVVVCDRFFDSTYAYQGYGRQLDLDSLRRITDFATGGLRPDLTLYISIDPEEGLRRRLKDSSAEWNRLDALAVEFHRRVQAGYQDMIRSEPERWVVIDGDRPVEVVQEDVKAAVMKRLKPGWQAGIKQPSG